MAPIISTRDKILQLAIKNLHQRGYQGLSYSQLSQPLALQNAAIHYHFPTKTDLGCALIQSGLERFKLWCSRQTAEFDGPVSSPIWSLHRYRTPLY